MSSIQYSQGKVPQFTNGTDRHSLTTNNFI